MGERRQSRSFEIFYNIIRWKKRLEYYIGEGAKPNIYKLIPRLFALEQNPLQKI